MIYNYTPNDRIRFWEKVDKSGGDNACWIWTAHRNLNGYGQFRVGSRKTKRFLSLSNRVAWELTNGEIPDGLFVCHSCDNPSCCNPDHLWLGTPLANTRDMINKGRTKHLGRKGEMSSHHKLTQIEVISIRELYNSENYTQRELAKQFSVSQCLINKIINGKLWNDQID